MTLSPAQSPEPTLTDSAPLLRILFGFWEAKALMCAVQLDIFNVLASGAADCATIIAKTGLHERSARDFLDSLVALKLLTREGGIYSCTLIAKHHLDRTRPEYLGGLVGLADTRLYPVWAKLENALRSGVPQNEASHVADYYSNLVANEDRLRAFVEGMAGLSMDVFAPLCSAIDWELYSTLVDVGGAQGFLAARLVEANPHLHGITFDLPDLAPLFMQHRSTCRESNQLSFKAGDFFRDPLPEADVMILGHVLHNWSFTEKQVLISKAHRALRPGGVLLIYDAMIDEERREDAYALLMSLNMLLVTTTGATYTASECAAWLHAAGFRSSHTRRLTPGATLIVATK